jgi:general secretion pathway protein C
MDGPSLLRNAAMVALATGLGLWGAILLAPTPSTLPPMLQSATPTGQETATLARWFGGGALRVRIAVTGIIAGPDGLGAALLSVNGAAPQAFRTGQALAPGVSLAGVAHDAVSIDQDGVIERVAVPRRTDTAAQGFIPVPHVSLSP